MGSKRRGRQSGKILAEMDDPQLIDTLDSTAQMSKSDLLSQTPAWLQCGNVVVFESHILSKCYYCRALQRPTEFKRLQESSNRRVAAILSERPGPLGSAEIKFSDHNAVLSYCGSCSSGSEGRFYCQARRHYSLEIF